MADAYQIETSTDRYLLESGTGVYLLEDTLFIRDSFDRADQANFGTADEGGAWANDANSSILSNKARLTIGASGSSSIQLPGKFADIDAKAMVRFSNVTSFDTELRARYNGSTQWVRAGLGPSTGGSFFLQNRIAGVTTTIATVGSQGFVAATDYWVRMQLNGVNTQARWWADGTAEPGTWTISGTTVVVEAGTFGIDAFASTAVNIDWDSLNVGAIGSNDEMYMPYIGGGYYA